MVRAVVPQLKVSSSKQMLLFVLQLLAPRYAYLPALAEQCLSLFQVGQQQLLACCFLQATEHGVWCDTSNFHQMLHVSSIPM
jgi:hypothetical protein